MIHLAYATEGSDPHALELHKVSAHEVRALSASCGVFRGMNVDCVMQSCTWRSRNTFSEFYLRDIQSALVIMRWSGSMTSWRVITYK